MYFIGGNYFIEAGLYFFEGGACASLGLWAMLDPAPLCCFMLYFKKVQLF